MDAGTSRLADRCAQVARQMSLSQVESVVDFLLRSSDSGWDAVYHALLGHVPAPGLKQAVGDLLKAWRDHQPTASPRELALTLLAAARAIDSERNSEIVDLVWTGPDYTGIALRRTDQALLEVIGAAQHNLLIVSFAIYMVPSVSTALVQAAQRGVSVRICLETGTSAEGQMAYDTVAALGEDVRRNASVYFWPIEHRPVGQNGRPGVLHVKCAVADQTLLFVSSANLTSHALDINMELGILVRNGPLPGQVVRHFQRLIEHGVLTRIT